MSVSIPVFSDRPKAVATPKLRALVKFPGNVEATTGIDVTKSNGTYTFTTDWSQFATIPTFPSSPTNCVLTYDSTTHVYLLVPSQSLDSSDKVSKSGDTMSGPLTLPGAPTLANHAATKAYVDTTSAATGFVLKTGDTMTGDLRATYNDPRIILTKPTGVHLNGIFGRAGADLSRWLIQLGDGTVETGINTGSNFAITRYDDGGFEVDSPISIVRATGVVTIPKLASTAVSGTVTMLPSGTSAGGTSAVLGIGYAGGGTQYGISLRPTTDSTAALYFFNAANSGVGNVTVTSTATSYNTSSDERLKEAFETFDAGRIVDNTEVYSFAWKSTGERSYGVSAQEANETFPQAVTYVKEQDWWGIDYSKYVPVLLQELKTLRARVAELEDKLAVKPS